MSRAQTLQSLFRRTRRPGDIATSLADPSKANEKLEWRADRGIDVMISDAWRWQSKHPHGFNGEPSAD